LRLSLNWIGGIEGVLGFRDYPILPDRDKELPRAPFNQF